jgi:hypothetical protein
MSVSAKSHTVAEPLDGDVGKSIKQVAKKLFILYSPWPSWTISGCWIAGASTTPATGKITETDDAGKEILSYVPFSLTADFLSKAGQSIVSCPESHYIFFVLMDASNNP